jgi:pimeloyl-ACP methyl ester carboxylesterase
MGGLRTLVLVHGAFQGPWCFDLIRPALEDRGVPTVAPHLALDTLADDVATVRGAIDAIDGPVVLLGHSYAGTVNTWAGDHPAVASLIYLAAGMPDVGEGIGSGPNRTTQRTMLPGFVIGDDGLMRVDPATAIELFYPDAEPLLAAGWAARVRPTRVGFGEVVPVAAWRDKPVDYIVCRDDRALPAATQHWLAARAGATVHELPGDHSPFLTKPDALVDILARVMTR